MIGDCILQPLTTTNRCKLFLERVGWAVRDWAMIRWVMFHSATLRSALIRRAMVRSVRFHLAKLQLANNRLKARVNSSSNTSLKAAALVILVQFEHSHGVERKGANSSLQKV